MANYIRDEMKLKVQVAAHYDGTFHRNPPPIEMGFFSLDSGGNFCDDDHQMKYLSMPKKLNDLCMDLNVGFRDYIHVHEDTANDDSGILKWILSHKDKVGKKCPDTCNSPKIDFVCFRGLLTTISSTVYEKYEDWLFYATKFRSVIYFRDGKMKEVINATEDQKRIATWGFKFEQYMVSDAKHLNPDTSIPVNQNEKYFSVVKKKLGHHHLLFTAEVDAVDPKQESTHRSSSMLRYIELKTLRIIMCDKDNYFFLRYKLIKWYLQSYLAGIPRVICGVRDDAGIVRELKSYNVEDMPRLAEDYWSADACLNFCSQFLDYVKRCVVKDDPKVVYKFYWKPGSDIICEELDSQHRFLPEWYTDKVEVI